VADYDIDPTTDAPPTFWPQQPDDMLGLFGPGGSPPARLPKGGVPHLPSGPVPQGSPVGVGLGDVGQASAPAFDPSQSETTPSFLQKLSYGFKHAASHVADTIGGNLVPNSQLRNPDGTPYYSDEDMAQARRQALIGLGMGMASARPGFSTLPGAFAQGIGASQQAGQQTLTGIMNQRQQSIQMAQQANILAGRRAIAAKYAIQPNDPNRVILRKLEASAAESTQRGDYEGAGEYAKAADAVRQKATEVPPGGTAVDENGNVIYHNPSLPPDLANTIKQQHMQWIDKIGTEFAGQPDVHAHVLRTGNAAQLRDLLASGQGTPQQMAGLFASVMYPNRTPSPISVDELKAMGGLATEFANALDKGVGGKFDPQYTRIMTDALNRQMAGSDANYYARQAEARPKARKLGLSEDEIDAALPPSAWTPIPSTGAIPSASGGGGAGGVDPNVRKLFPQ